MGTSVGTEVFVKYGWRAGAALSMGWYALQLVLILIRGPHCERWTWIGYEGGLEARKSLVEERRRERESGEAVTRGQDCEIGDSEKASPIIRTSQCGGDIKARNHSPVPNIVDHERKTENGREGDGKGSV